MDTTDELVECLRRKGCPLTVARLADELKKAPQVIEANLGVLRRAGVVQILRPGEWELAPEKLSTEPLIPPEPPAAIARARPLVLVSPSTTDQPTPGTRPFTPYSRLTPPPKPQQEEEGSMGTATKVCTECEKRKPADEFYTGNAKCKVCYNERQKARKEARAGKAARPKPQGGVAPPKKKTNGAVRSLREIRKKHAKPNGAGRFTDAIEHLMAARAELLGDVAKIDAAIAQIQALG